MSLCRECEVVLWRHHESCPSCRAQSPHAGTVVALARHRSRPERLAVAVAVAAPALLMLDAALRWLLSSS